MISWDKDKEVLEYKQNTLCQIPTEFDYSHLNNLENVDTN